VWRRLRPAGRRRRRSRGDSCAADIRQKAYYRHVVTGVVAVALRPHSDDLRLQRHSWSPVNQDLISRSRAAASRTTATRHEPSTDPDEVGIRRPSLSTTTVEGRAVREVLLDSFADWNVSTTRSRARARAAPGQRVLRAAFLFFEEHPEFVRLVRWEALEGGDPREELAVLSRPLFDGARRSSEARWTRATAPLATASSAHATAGCSRT